MQALNCAGIGSTHTCPSMWLPQFVIGHGSFSTCLRRHNKYWITTSSCKNSTVRGNPYLTPLFTLFFIISGVFMTRIFYTCVPCHLDTWSANTNYSLWASWQRLVTAYLTRNTLFLGLWSLCCALQLKLSSQTKQLSCLRLLGCYRFFLSCRLYIYIIHFTPYSLQCIFRFLMETAL